MSGGSRDTGLDELLALNGHSFNVQGEYWVKFEVRQTTPNEDRPHGINYCLTLHDGDNNRIMGYDNAHVIKVSSGYKGKRHAYDHKHRSIDDKGVEYVFDSPYKLIEDLWGDVEKSLAELEVDDADD